MKAIIALAALLLLACVASAGTVTLTGVCSSVVIGNATNYATFSLLNSGNETATNLIVLPKFSGAAPLNASESLASIAPGQNLTMKFYFDNFSTPGSYAGSFTVAYAQGASTFFALFPCVLSFVNSTYGIVDISAINQSGNTISVSLINLGSGAINASIALLLPPEFSAYPPNQSIALQPGATQKVRFTFTQPPISQASFAIAASASYYANGLHYASIRQYLLSFYKTGSSSGPLSQYLPYIITLVVILVIVSLIAFAAVRKRRMLRSRAAPKEGKTE